MISPRGATRAVHVTRRRGREAKRARDALAVEEPLEIRVAWTSESGARVVEALAVTMRTPGDDFELVAGFLYGEGVVSCADDLTEITYCRGGEAQEYNIVEARLGPGVTFEVDTVRRNFYTTSSCGVCGKASLDAVEAHGCSGVPDGPVVDAEFLAALPDRLLESQGVFERTGGLHAAGLFGADGAHDGVKEDVGRHNAVDKVIGQALLARVLPASEAILVVSGRASFELVQKSVRASVPILVAVGAPSSLAVDMSRRFNQTLVGFTRGGGFNIYCGAERVG